MKRNPISLVLFFIFICNTILSAQQVNNKVNPENMAKIILYDSDEALKKIKIKSAQKKNIVIQAISKHNNKINELKIFNYETFNNVKTFLERKRKEALLNRDFSTMKESRMKANEMLEPIRAEAMKQQMILNNTLNLELSEKEYKKWLKYQQSELKKLNPKAPERPQMQRQGQGQMQRQMRGVGRNGQRRSRY